jgi:hypothetical protein
MPSLDWQVEGMGLKWRKDGIHRLPCQAGVMEDVLPAEAEKLVYQGRVGAPMCNVIVDSYLVYLLCKVAHRIDDHFLWQSEHACWRGFHDFVWICTVLRPSN